MLYAYIIFYIVKFYKLYSKQFTIKFFNLINTCRIIASGKILKFFSQKYDKYQTYSLKFKYKLLPTKTIFPKAVFGGQLNSA